MLRACNAQLMFKLRKELGDTDFKKIFEDPDIQSFTEMAAKQSPIPRERSDIR